MKVFKAVCPFDDCSECTATVCVHDPPSTWYSTKRIYLPWRYVEVDDPDDLMSEGVDDEEPDE